MKKLSPVLAILIVFSACDNASSPSGNGQVLSEIRYNSGNQNWEDTYEYNGNGQVATITTNRSLGEKKVFSYSGDLLSEIRTIRLTDDQLIFRDSMAYNEAGQLAKIYNFSINISSDVGLSQIASLTYNNAGQVIESRTEYTGLGDYAPRRVYHWQNGNVVQTDHYDGDELQQEFFYTYDDRPAFDIENFVALGEPELATKNNIISTDWTDYTGLLDTVCKPCETNYVYNLNKLPISLQTNWGFSATFIYEEIVSRID